MPVIHLSEIEIQEYLDNNANQNKVETHIMGCEECAIILAEYESFYTELSKDESPKLSTHFVSNTMVAVREESIALENNKGFYLYSIVSLVCAFFLIKYYVGFSFSLPKLIMPQFHNVFADWSVFATAVKFYHSSPNTVNVLLFAGIIMIFFGLVDMILAKKNLSKISCFSI